MTKKTTNKCQKNDKKMTDETEMTKKRQKMTKKMTDET